MPDLSGRKAPDPILTGEKQTSTVVHEHPEWKNAQNDIVTSRRGLAG